MEGANSTVKVGLQVTGVVEMLAQRTLQVAVKVRSYGELILKTDTGENPGEKDGRYYGLKLIAMGFCVKPTGRERKNGDESVTCGGDP